MRFVYVCLSFALISLCFALYTTLAPSSTTSGSLSITISNDNNVENTNYSSSSAFFQNTAVYQPIRPPRRWFGKSSKNKSSSPVANVSYQWTLNKQMQYSILYPSSREPKRSNFCEQQSSPQNASSTPSNRTKIVFLGDSIIRFVYMSFVMTIHNGGTPPPPHVIPNPLSGGLWPSWQEYLDRTNTMFGGRESCDCFRNATVVKENRKYYPSSGPWESVSLYLWFPGGASGGGIRIGETHTMVPIQEFIQTILANDKPDIIVTHVGIHPWEAVITHNVGELERWLGGLERALSPTPPRPIHKRIFLWTTVSLIQSSHHVSPKQYLNPTRFPLLGRNSSDIVWFPSGQITSDLVRFHRMLPQRFKKVAGSPYVDKVHWRPRVVNEITQLFT
eukprot:PhF_6_TR30814/c0_g1_i1/m.45364